MTVASPPADVESLPFDQYQRYRLVGDLLDEVRGARPLRVLDVGGRTALLRAFLPRDRVELVDVEASDAGGLVLGDGAALPFRTGAFDAVCAFDTLEHVPPPARQAFVAECARVAGRWVILAGPYASPRVDEAEERLVDFLRHKLQTEHRYLSEHRAHGLPDRDQARTWLEAAGARVASFGHGDLSRWLALMCLELYLDHDPLLRPVAARFFRFYNRALFDSDHGAEVYRHALVGAFGRARLPKGARLSDPVQAPAGATEAVTALAAELIAFDREKDAWQPELARLAEVIAGLERDVAGHRSSLAERSADLETHRASLAELRSTYERAQAEHDEEKGLLEADLVEHARALAAARATAERARSEAATDRAAFEKDLDEHRAALETVQADLVAHRASLADLRAQVAQLEASAEEQATASAELEADLRDQIARHEASAAEQATAVAALEADLRDQIARHEAAAAEQAATAAALEADLRGQIDAHRAHQRTLEGQLAETQAGAEAIQAELLRANADLEVLAGDLEARDQELAHLRAELRDRWKNLKRAFGRKPGG